MTDKKSFPDKKSVKYTVVGLWPFPTDMLRHDDAKAATPEDQAKIDNLSQEFAADRGSLRDDQRITLVAEGSRFYMPNVARWKSFGWNVERIVDMSGSMSEPASDDCTPTPGGTDYAAAGEMIKKAFYEVSLRNSGGELSALKIIVEDGTEEGPLLKAAAIELIQSCAYLNDGDQIVIRDITTSQYETAARKLGWSNEGCYSGFYDDGKGSQISYASWEHLCAENGIDIDAERRDPTRKLRSEESFEDRLDDLGESPDY